MPRVGVIGSLVWDEIHGRDPATGVVEEWGGIAYALASLDAHLPESWEIVPLIKVGFDKAAAAREFLASLRRLLPGARCVEVPVPNNRVVLHYESAEGGWSVSGKRLGQPPDYLLTRGPYTPARLLPRRRAQPPQLHNGRLVPQRRHLPVASQREPCGGGPRQRHDQPWRREDLC